MHRKILIISVIFCSLAIGCRKSAAGLVENNQAIAEKSPQSQILTNLTEPLQELANICCILCGDDACFTNAEIAGSLLKAIDLSGKNYFQDCSKIFSAYTQIFVGTSYFGALMQQSRLLVNGDNYDFMSEWANSTTLPFETPIVDLKLFLEKELQVSNCFAFFLKAYEINPDKLLSSIDYCIAFMDEQYSNLPDSLAFKLASVNNQLATFMTLSHFSWYLSNIANSDLSEHEQNIMALAIKMDEILKIARESSVAETVVFTDEKYWQCMVKSSEIQKELLKILVERLLVIKRNSYFE